MVRHRQGYRGRRCAYVLTALSLMLSGCSYSSGTVTCPQGGGGSWQTARMGVALEASVPVCQPGSATVSSDPSQGVGIASKALDLAAGLTKLVTPGP